MKNKGSVKPISNTLITEIDNALAAEIRLLSSNDFATKEQSIRAIPVLANARKEVIGSVCELLLNEQLL